MSSTVEYRHIAIAIPDDQGIAAVRAIIPDAAAPNDWGQEGHRYVVFTEMGASNCYQRTQSGGWQRERSWHLYGAGSIVPVLKRVTMVAGHDVLDGLVVLRKRTPWTLPENYIRTYRVALESAITLEELHNTYPSFAPRIRIRGDAPIASKTCPWRDAFLQSAVAANQATGFPEWPSSTEWTFDPACTTSGLAQLYWLSMFDEIEGPPASLLNAAEVTSVVDAIDGARAMSSSIVATSKLSAAFVKPDHKRG